MSMADGLVKTAQIKQETEFRKLVIMQKADDRRHEASEKAAARRHEETMAARETELLTLKIELEKAMTERKRHEQQAQASLHTSNNPFNIHESGSEFGSM